MIGVHWYCCVDDFYDFFPKLPSALHCVSRCKHDMQIQKWSIQDIDILKKRATKISILVNYDRNIVTDFIETKIAKLWQYSSFLLCRARVTRSSDVMRFSLTGAISVNRLRQSPPHFRQVWKINKELILARMPDFYRQISVVSLSRLKTET